MVNTTKLLTRVFLLCASALVCAGCFSPWTGEDDAEKGETGAGSVAVRISVPDARAAISYPPTAANIGQIEHTVTLTRVENGGTGYVPVNPPAEITHVIPAGETRATITGVPPGFYLIEVYGAWYGNFYSLYPSPSAPTRTPVEVIAGQTATPPDPIAMTKNSDFILDGYTAITSADELKKIADLDPEYPLNGKYLLTEDITLSGEWTPIGTGISGSYFSGTFDGNGKTITGLTITSGGNYQGLFGVVDGEVKNLTLKQANISGGFYVGGIAGLLNSGTISNCSVVDIVKIEGDSPVGGVVGENNTGIIRYCSATGSVTGTGDQVGGVVGNNVHSGAAIEYCFAAGDVEGGYYVGGVVGSNQDSGSVRNCYYDGDLVKGSSDSTTDLIVGGVVGRNTGSSSIEYCYATGEVVLNSTATTSGIGGIVGSNSGTVQFCVALNTNLTMPTGITDFGRVAGTPATTLTGNYGKLNMRKNGIYDATTWYPVGVSVNNGADLSDADYLTASWWRSTLGWIDSAWNIMDGELPTLKEQP